jgi:anti-sigma B factor antagonist
MDLVAETLGGALVVRAQMARIDAAIAIAFKEQMRALVAGSESRVILDMARVEFLDSSGLGAVVAVMKMLGPDRRLELAALTPAVERVFRLTRMDRVFTLHATAPPAGGGADGGVWPVSTDTADDD